jgi:hypothetical protein
MNSMASVLDEPSLAHLRRMECEYLTNLSNLLILFVLRASAKIQR